MKRTDGDAFVPITSALGNPVNGFGDGNPATPTTPSQVKADWLNNVQEELMTVLDEAGVAPNGTFGQLYAALSSLFASIGITAAHNVWLGRNDYTAEGQINGAPVNLNRGSIPNSLNGRAVHKAHASIALNTSGTPTLDAADSYNLHSTTPVQCPGGSVLRVNLNETLAGSHFLAAAALPTATVTLGDEISAGTAATTLVPFIFARTRDSVDIKIRRVSDGALQDPAGAGLNGLRVYVHVEGQQ